MQKLLLVLAALASFTCLNACSVYKSSDREDFNANGKARASNFSSFSSLSTKPNDNGLSPDDKDLLQAPCNVFRMMPLQQIESVMGTSRLTFTNQVSRKTSTCIVELSDANAATDSLDSLSVLSCSWKPVNGHSIRVRNSLSVQTTENDYRDNGFRVLTTNVASGGSLRMNCEGYVATPALVRAIDKPESAEILTIHFAELAIGLNRATLTSTMQR